MSFLLLWILQSLYVGLSHQAPVPQDGQPLVGWVSDPNGRGTLGLISSCVFTLALCVWSAMHLNIPPKYKTKSQRYWYNTKWIVLGILIPELVILSAWRQWLSARRLTKEMKMILEQSDGEVSKSKKDETELLIQQSRHEWTFVHSMYAGMGGFVFDMSLLPSGDDAFIPTYERLHLTPLGVLLLAKCGLLPNISLQDIKDKSKADGLAKTIVCIQAGWMVLQTIGRVIAKQPVTLLEVNTMGHVFCAFIIYLLWWKKPKEVNEPTIITGAGMPQLCAFFYSCSRISGRAPTRRIQLPSWTIPEMADYAWFPDANIEEFMKTRSHSVSSSRGASTTPSRHNSDRALRRFTSNTTTSPDEKGMLLDKPYEPPKRKTTGFTHRRANMTYAPVRNDTDHKRSVRLILASHALRTFSCLHEPVFNFTGVVVEEDPSENKEFTRPRLQQLVADEASDWPSDYYLPGIAGQLMGMVLWLTAMCYGAVHAAAWADFFPTEAEKFIWRFSSIYITSASALWFFVNALAARVSWAKVWYHRFVAIEGPWYEYLVCVPGAIVCGLAYIFARSYLVIGAVVSLRKVPANAYNTPNWSDVIPHF